MKGGTDVDASNQARLTAWAEVAKALAHPSRLAMIEELARGERCVCELQALVGHDMSTVSRHLSVLRAAGIVDDEKRGAWVYYRLKCPCILGVFSCVDAVVQSKAGVAAAD